MMNRSFLAVIAAFFAMIEAAGAVLPDEMLDDPALEARAREISKELRCVVCQNQSIDDSHAPLAADMRRLVRERILAGDSDEDVKEYLVARYGDFVLLRPPVQSNTVFLWIGPGLFVAAAFAGFAIYWRRKKGADLTTAPALTEEEEARLAALTEEAAK